MARITYVHHDPTGWDTYDFFESDDAQRFEGFEPEIVDCTCADHPDEALCAYVPTASPYAEELYKTRDGWVLNRIVISDGGAAMSTYELVDNDTARQWLRANDFEFAATSWFDLPPITHQSVRATQAQVELLEWKYRSIQDEMAKRDITMTIEDDAGAS